MSARHPRRPAHPLRLRVAVLLAALVLGATDPAPARAGSVQVEFRTTLGTFVLEMDEQRAPQTVGNFLRYVDDGFYDGLVFHRVIAGFVVQTGGYDVDFNARETRRPVRNESRETLPNHRGTVAMARTTNPHSADSQFFINLVDNPSLDAGRASYGYAVFGKVVDGWETVEKIAATPTAESGGMPDVPVTPVIIHEAARVGD